MRVLALVLLLASCDRVFGLGDPYEDARVAGDMPRVGDGSDIRVIDASATAQLLIHYNFEGNLSEESGRPAASCFSCSYVASRSAALGLAVRFDGTACMQFAMPDQPAAVSLAMWAKTDSGATKPLIVRPYSSNQPAPASWRVDEDNDSIAITTFDGTGPLINSGGGANAFVTGVWHHLAVVATASERAIYVDGRPLIVSGGVAGIVYQDGNTVSVGCEATGSGTFAGDIDDLRVYAGALRADEVTALAQ